MTFDVRQVFEDAAALHQHVGATQQEPLMRAAQVILDALQADRQVLVFGNGGSATDAQHLAAELVGRFQRERRPVPVMSLAADVGVLTCLGNDYGYDQIFSRQVEAFGRPGDVAIAITTSGASPNVNLALAKAREQGMVTVGITGRDGGETGRLVDHHLNVSHTSTARVQEVQRTMIHVLCQAVEEGL